MATVRNPHWFGSDPVKSVALVGGVHGNETTGVCLPLHYMAKPELVARPSFKTVTLLGNEKAIQANTRYMDMDLNRCFLPKLCEDPNASQYECRRAHELSTMLGPKYVYGADDTAKAEPKLNPNPKCDFIIDCHNSTSNMGLLLCYDAADHFTRRLVQYLMGKIDGIRTCFWMVTPPFLSTVARSGFALELSPAPWGCASAALFEKGKAIIQASLDFIEMSNQRFLASSKEDIAPGVPSPLVYPSPIATRTYLTAIRGALRVDYPRNPADQTITGLVHPELQDRDFEPFEIGQPLLINFDGTVARVVDEEFLQSVPPLPALKPEILYGDGDGEGLVVANESGDQKEKQPPKRRLCPFFINEAAYYESKIAFIVGEEIRVPVL